jgi:RNA polymerase sigma-70 factor (ECF subfamily)
LIATLDPGVVLRADGGGRVPGVARRPIRGADHVARFLGGLASKQTVALRPRIINGSAGLVLVTDDVVRGVMGFSVSGGRITEIDFVLNPEKLRRVDP